MNLESFCQGCKWSLCLAGRHYYYTPDMSSGSSGDWGSLHFIVSSSLLETQGKRSKSLGIRMFEM